MSASRPTDRRNYICIIYLLFIRPRLVRGSTNYSRNIDKGKLEIRNRWLLMYCRAAIVMSCVCVCLILLMHTRQKHTPNIGIIFNADNRRQKRNRCNSK